MKTEILIRLDVPDYYKNKASALEDMVKRSISTTLEGIVLEDTITCLETKVWTDEDVRAVLSENGYKPSDANVAKVKSTGLLKYLDDATDEDWSIIRNAIEHANMKKGLE